MVASVGSFCREVSEQHGVEINFTNTGVPASLPSEVSICIFRVVQETLRNAIKHSGVKIFKVCLRGAGGVIVLRSPTMAWVLIQKWSASKVDSGL